jgi:hypothetical protein
MSQRSGARRSPRRSREANLAVVGADRIYVALRAAEASAQVVLVSRQRLKGGIEHCDLPPCPRLDSSRSAVNATPRTVSLSAGRAERDAGYPRVLSERRVEDEHIGLDVGVDVVAADEGNDLAAGEAFDGRTRIGFHGFLEELANVVHDMGAVGSGEGLLRVREDPVH